jgi:uncharacterized protein YecT (DUF1311 family)
MGNRLSPVFLRGLFVLLAAGASSLFAQNLSTSTPPPPMLAEICKDAKSLQESNDCMEQAALKVKREFNRYFAKLTESIKDEKAKGELRLAQDRWGEYRDKSCSAAFDFYSSGVMRAIMEFTCEIQLTHSRTKDLDVIYHYTDKQ